MYSLHFKKIIMVACILLSACSSPGVKALSGQWQLSESKLNDTLVVKEELSETTFTISFDTESKASGMTACNRWSSSYLLNTNATNKSLLSTKPAALTRKRCHHKSNEIGDLYRQFPNALTSQAEVEKNGNTLSIKWSNGNYWILEEIE